MLFHLKFILAHWGRVTHKCVSKLATVGSDNGLSPGMHQAIIWTSAGLLLTWPLGTNFSEMLFEIQTFSFTKMNVKMSSAKWRPFCLGVNVLFRQFDIAITVFPFLLWKNRIHKNSFRPFGKYFKLTSRLVLHVYALNKFINPYCVTHC